LDSESSTGGDAHEKVIYGVCVREVEQMASSADHMIGCHATKGNQPVAVTVNVMDRHRELSNTGPREDGVRCPANESRWSCREHIGEELHMLDRRCAKPARDERVQRSRRMQQPIRNDPRETAQSVKRWCDASRGPAASEQENVPRREMTREFERDHSSERCAAEIERLLDVKHVCESSCVVLKHLGSIGRENPRDRPDVANHALWIKKTFVPANPWENKEW
jgi:hypothetical protein